MRFRYRPLWGMSASERAYIRFTLLYLDRLPAEVGEAARELAREVGGEYFDALWAAITSEDDMERTAFEYHMDRSTVGRLVRRYFKEYRKRFM